MDGQPKAHEPELQITWRDSATRAVGRLIVDSLETGIAYAGVRAEPRADETSLAWLARLRTTRYRLANVRLSGAVMALEIDPGSPELPAVLARFLVAMRPFIASTVSLGPDAHVPAELLDEVIAKNELPWRMEAMQKRDGWPDARWQDYQAILGSPVGSETLRDAQTAISVVEATHAVADLLLRRAYTVSVFGSESFALKIGRQLVRKGVKVMAIGNASMAVHSRDGLSAEFFDSGDIVASDPGRNTFITSDEFLGLPVDVVIIASQGGAITVENVGRLRCGMLVEAAASSISSHAEMVLDARGTPILPSFAATLGPVFLTDGVLSGRVRTAEQAVAHLCERTQAIARELVRLGSTLHISLRDAGARLAFHHRLGKPAPRPLHTIQIRAISSDDEAG